MPDPPMPQKTRLEIARKLEAMGVEQLETFATYNESDKRCAELLMAQTDLAQADLLMLETPR